MGWVYIEGWVYREVSVAMNTGTPLFGGLSGNTILNKILLASLWPVRLEQVYHVLCYHQDQSETNFESPEKTPSPQGDEGLEDQP